MRSSRAFSKKVIEVPGVEWLHSRIARTLRERIANGVYSVGTQIPAEGRLAEEFAVSRSTVRQALRQLQADWLIEPRKGSGSVVLPVPKADTPVLHATSIDDLLAFSTGYQFHVQSSGIETLRPDLTVKVGSAPRDGWLTLKGLGKSREHERPDNWAEYYIRKDYSAIGRLLANPVISPIFPLMEKRFGIRIVEVRQDMSATVITPEQAAVLNVNPGSLGISVQRFYKTNSDDVPLITLAVYPAHRFSHSITLHRA
jgi:GntR family transcriptional regulator